MATFTLGPPEPYEGATPSAGAGVILGEPEPYGAPATPARPVGLQSMRETGQLNRPPVDITTPIKETASRAAAYLYAPGSAARPIALAQRGLPPQAGFGQEFLAELGGEAPVMAGAMLGGTFGAMSPIPGGALIGAGLGGGLSALYRYLAGDELTPAFAWERALPRASQDALWEAAFAGMGPAVGRGVQTVRQWGKQPGAPQGAQGYIAGLRGTVPVSTDAASRAAENYTLARQMEQRTGIPFGRTPGELLEDPFVREREALMFQHPGTARSMQTVLEARSASAEALGKQLAQSFTPSHQLTSSEGYAALPQAAKELVDGMRTRRTALMEPLYSSVLRNAPPVDVTRLRKELVGRRRTVTGDAATRLEKTIAGIDAAAGDGSTVPGRVLHGLQKSLSADARKLGVDTSEGRALLFDVSKPIQRSLRRASRDYDTITRRYAELSDRLDKFVGETRFGQLSGVNPARYADAGRQIMRNAQAGDIRKLRRDLRSAIKDVYGEGGGRAVRENEVMQGLKTAWFEDALMKIQPKESGDIPNVGGKLYRLFGGAVDQPGGKAQMEMLEALLSPRERPRLNELTKALQQTSALYSRGSQTAGRLQAGRDGGFLTDLFTETALGGKAAFTRILARAAPGFTESVMAGGRETNRAHAAAIVGGLESSMQHLRELNRDLQRLRLRPPIDLDNEVARAWGLVLGNLGRSGYEAVVPEPSAAEGFAGG